VKLRGSDAFKEREGQQLSGTKQPKAKPLAGTVVPHGDAWTLRVRIAGKHHRIRLGALSEMSEAKAHEKGAAWRERLAREGYQPHEAPIRAGVLTFRQLGELWTSGKLATQYPDHVKAKRSADDDRYRLEKHVYPHIGDVPIPDFSLDHAEKVMGKLPSDPSAATTRRHVAQLMTRIMSIAVFPLRLIKASPIPRGFLPKPAPSKALPYLYPDEDRTLLGCTLVPLCWRIFYGFLDREGSRTSEAIGLTVSDLDLVRGAVTLDKNKTDDPRAWALLPGDVRALRAWFAHREAALGRKLRADEPVFIDEEGGPIQDQHLADRLRSHLMIAKIDRAALFEKSDARRPMRAHDLRGTFVTLALANGRTESWVMDRTGHKSSLMINRYRRTARTAAELGLGDLTPLDEAIPELAARSTDGVPPQAAPSGSSADASDEVAGERAQARAHAELNVAKRREPSPKSSVKKRLPGDSFGFRFRRRKA
jgi:integrase